MIHILSLEFSAMIGINLVFNVKTFKQLFKVFFVARLYQRRVKALLATKEI